MHGNHVPGIPLKRVTPEWVYGHAIWTYLAAVLRSRGYPVVCWQENPRSGDVAGLDRALRGVGRLRANGVVERASLGNGLNYVSDTLMFCGAVLLLAGAMPREA